MVTIFQASATNVVMNDIVKLTVNGLYSIDTRGKEMTTSTFYDQISSTINLSNKLDGLASVGFYKTGQLLNKARLELKKDFGKLQKQLGEDGLHIKQQQRYMAIARNPNIRLNMTKLPPEWTFWEKLTKLDDEQFSKISKLIHKEAKWKDIELFFGKGKNFNGNKNSLNDKDNRTEIFGLEVNKTLSKKDKKALVQLKKDVTKLSQKYKFISLKKKNYFDEVHKFLASNDLDNDTSVVEDKEKFKKSYSSKKKIDI